MLHTSATVRRLNGWVVSTYKIFGFGVLLSLVFGMASFLAVNLFFMLNHSWIVPVILSPNQDRVVTTNVNFIEQIYQTDKLRTEKAATEAELAHIRHAMALHEQFQANFAKALAVEERQKLAKLRRLSGLSKELDAATRAIEASNRGVRDITKKQLADQYSARLIAQDELIKGQHIVNQMATLDLSQREKREEIQDRIREMDSDVRAQAELNEVLGDGQPGVGTATAGKGIGTKERTVFSIDVLMREQQYLQSEIARSELASRVAPLELQLDKIGSLLAEHEKMLAALRNSPYVRASKEPVTIAFVSYDNLPEVQMGSSVFGCELGFVLCRKTGTVTKILDGEVTSRHPITNRDLRGVMVEIQLADARWAEKPALMLNHAPLLL